jgi:hypothetical protein
MDEELCIFGAHGRLPSKEVKVPIELHDIELAKPQLAGTPPLKN